MNSLGTEPGIAAGSGTNGAGWGRAAALAVLASLVILGLFWPTAWSMVEIWWRSETFTHGFLVVPIALWLIWHRRHHVAASVPAFSWHGFTAFLAAAFAWLAGYLADALVVEQFGFVGMLIGGIWATLGNQAARELAFALLFFLFAVPVGEALIAPLMEFTASTAVGLLRLTGVPVYREGLFFSIPSGNWSVVEACSGIRYVIASLTLGVLYAYLAYQSRWRRLAFILVSALVPVLANGVRAYLIVLLAHLSDMKLAAGVDHLIYGWVFFGIVMLIMFSIGSIWREPEAVAPPPAEKGAVAAHWRGVALGASAVVIVALLLRSVVGQMAAYQSAAETPTALPAAIGDWVQTAERPWPWSPIFLPAELGASTTYRRGETALTVDVAHFVQQRQGAEAINSQNMIVRHGDKVNTAWRVVDQSETFFDTAEGRVAAEAFLVRGPQSLAVWRWYRIGTRYTTNHYLAKLYQAIDRLTLNRTDGAIVVVAAPVDSRDKASEAEIRDFVSHLVPELSRALDKSVGE